jgi:DNA-binding transcriptional LysR family regulator
MNKLSLTHLRVFCEVADCLSVTQAASRLHRTQPAVSRSLAELEKELGVSLFIRQGRQITLTPAGEELRLRSRSVLGETDELVRRAQELSSGTTSMLRIGAMSISLERVVAPILHAFGQAHPEIGIRIVEADAPELAVLVESGQLDLAFTRDITSDSLASVRLFPMHVVAVAPTAHPLAGRDSVDVRELEREPLLLTREGTGSRVLLARACRAEGLTLRDIRVESRSYDGLLALVQGGLGIAIVLSTVASARPRAKVLPVLHRGDSMGIWFSAVWHRQRPPLPHQRALVELARSLVADRYPGKEYGFAPWPASHRD